MLSSDNGREAILRLRGVAFRRAGTTILDGIDWTVRRGQHWALLGANGSGKTTLLKVVTGYEWATEGSVEVLGNRYGECNVPMIRRAIGWVSSALQERLPGRDSALQIVASGYDSSMGVYRSLSADELRHAEDGLALLGIGKLASRPYGLLSQGERQRVLIARALVNRPRLLILDEPCSGLDPRASYEFLQDLAMLAALPDAPSVVLVTHHIEEIGPWISRVLVLKDGGVEAEGEASEVLTAEVLGRAFGCRCEVEFSGERYWLRNVSFEEGRVKDDG